MAVRRRDPSLRRLGLTARDLKWLVSNGYAKHAREVTKPEDRTRKFRAGRTLVLTDQSCFVATTAGMSLTTIEVIPPDGGTAGGSGAAAEKWRNGPRWCAAGRIGFGHK